MDMEDDCIVEEVIPKIKKLKQARLQFQTLCSSDSSPSASTKKRKLESPGECKTPKIVKTTNHESKGKDSEVKRKDSIINESLTSNENGIDAINITEESSTPTNQNESKRNVKSKKTLFSKTEKKESHSPTASLTKFFKKCDKEQSKDKNENGIRKAKDEEEVESWNVSVIEDTNENCDKDIIEVDDDTVELKIDLQESSPDANSSQNDKTSCIDSDSDIAALSSDNEDNNEKETIDETTKDINNDSQKTPKQTSSERAAVGKSRRLTPKILQRQIESAKKREERQKLKMEKEIKRENRRKEKEAEREQKKKEKELRKQMEMEQKQKEKEAKEQDRKKKEEEKKKKEEEKLEVERKKQKAASNFASFFVAKKQEVKATDEENNTNAQTFMPFEVKVDMKVAPITRRILQEQEKLSLDEKYRNAGTKEKDLYLAEIKRKEFVPRKSGHTWPFEAKDEVILLEEEENDDNENVMVQLPTVVEKHRAKLLQFHENRRPPYWGTWRKRSEAINPRRPFSRDSKWFDYEVDSDDEWEEEEPGESLHGSEDEKDEENPDDDEYDVDNEFMVPHGYLSDEEARADEEENEDMNPETQKFKLKILGEQFEAERNEKTLRLKPKIIGCIWLGPNNTYPENTPKRVVDFLSARHAWVAQIPVVLPSEPSEITDVECNTPMTTKTRKTKVPEEALPDLIRLIHGNTYGRKFLVREFLTFWCKKRQAKENQMSKASLTQKISEIGKWMSCPDEGKLHSKACWYVPEEIRKEYLGDEELPLPNRWKYTLVPKRKREVSEGNEKTVKPEKEKKTVHLITQFTKKITQNEMKQQPSTEPAKSEPPKPILQRPPKRAVLISLPRIDHKVAATTNANEPENKNPNNDNKNK